MDKLINNHDLRSTYRVLNFNHLMQIYEKNYHQFKVALSYIGDQNKSSTVFLNNNSVQYEPISITKYTHIFRLYYKFKDHNHAVGSYALKPHLIYTLYTDAKLLEAKSLREFRTFDSSITEKISLNLRVYYWLKNIIEKSYKYQ